MAAPVPKRPSPSNRNPPAAKRRPTNGVVFAKRFAGALDARTARTETATASFYGRRPSWEENPGRRTRVGRCHGRPPRRPRAPALFRPHAHTVRGRTLLPHAGGERDGVRNSDWVVASAVNVVGSPLPPGPFRAVICQQNVREARVLCLTTYFSFGFSTRRNYS